MLLLAVGKRFINVDLITDVGINDDGSVVVYFAVTEGDRLTRSAVFENAEATALLEWLRANATKVPPGPTPTFTGARPPMTSH